MKQIFAIISFCLILASCSSDNDSNPEQIPNPTITSISATSARVGDIITINGQNFDPTENYVVSFNGVQGTITEKTTTFLKVQIPEGATSGEITLSFADQNLVIGNIEIIIDNNLIYAIKSDFVSDTETTKLVTIDPTNGNKMNILDLQTTDNFESASINHSTNQIFFVTSLGDGNFDTEIYTINVANNSFSMSNLNNDPEIDYQLLPITNGTLYAIKQSYISDTTTSKLVSINPTNGNETVILDLQTTDSFNSLAFNSQTNKIFGVTNIGDGNVDSEMFTIDLANTSYSFQPLSNQFKYELAISEDGILYGMEQNFDNNISSKLYTLNPTNGSKSLIVDMQTTDSFNNLILKGNKIIGATNIDFPNVDSEIYTIDLQNNAFSFVDFNNNNEIDFELVNWKKNAPQHSI